MRTTLPETAHRLPRWTGVLAIVAAGATAATCTDRLLPTPPQPPAAAAAAAAAHEVDPSPSPSAELPRPSPEADARVATVLRAFPGVIGPAAGAPLEPAPGGGVKARLHETGGRTTIAIELPGNGAAPVRLRDERSGMTAAFALQGATPAPLALSAGYAIYQGAAPSGGDVVHRLHPHGDEDYVYFPQEPKEKALHYTLDVGEAGGPAGLRLVEGLLELLDAGGVPRLRVAPPEVVDASGTHLAARLSVEGCAADTSPSGPWGRPVTPPGAASCVVSVTWPNEGVRYPLLVDPSWQETSLMVVGRWGHAVAQLPPAGAARVLVTGGVDINGNILDSAEIYEPLSQTFAPTAKMGVKRVAHTATTIPGSAFTRVLLAGTATQVGAVTPPEHLSVSTAAADIASARSTEIYDVSTGTFGPGPSMSVPRFYHTGTITAERDGLGNPDLTGRILLAGGTTDTASPATSITTSADVYDPSVTDGGPAGLISPTHTQLNVARFGHAAATLTTGAVLITGGIDVNGFAEASAETFCPPGDCSTFGTQDDFIPIADMAVSRAFHTATVLATATSDVLLAGGVSGSNAYTPTATYLANAELYTGGKFQGKLLPLSHARAFHTATAFTPPVLLNQDGGVGAADALLVGGFDGISDLSSVEAFFSNPGVFAPSVSTNFARRHGAAFQVNAGGNTGGGNGVLVMGGITGTNVATGTNGKASADAELFFKTIGDPCGTDLECLTGFCANGYCCNTACGTRCFSCAAAYKNDDAGNGICGPTVAGFELPIVCLTLDAGYDFEDHEVCTGNGNSVAGPASIICSPSTCGADNRCSTFCDNRGNDCSGSGWCDFAQPPDGGVPDAALGDDDGGDEGGSDGGVADDGGDAGVTLYGTCQSKGVLGQTCTDDNHCATGHCYDGFCCDRACDQQCQACNVPGTIGFCTTLGPSTGITAPQTTTAGALHSRSPCNGSGTLCGGTCAGSAVACGYPQGQTADGGVDPSLVFQSPDCTDGGLFETYPCDGKGGFTGVSSTCGGYLCQDSHTCLTHCGQDTDCITNYICAPTAGAGADAGTCQPLTGPLCDGNVTLRRPTSLGGNMVCPDNYACPSGKDACNTSCLSVLDCAPSFGCNDGKTCIAGLSTPATPSCSCEAPGLRDGSSGPSSAAALALVGLALTAARTRRRP